MGLSFFILLTDCHKKVCNFLKDNFDYLQNLILCVLLFKKIFRFTGGEIVNEFLLSTGYLPGAHHEQCGIYKKIIKANPSWKMNKNI